MKAQLTRQNKTGGFLLVGQNHREDMIDKSLFHCCTGVSPRQAAVVGHRVGSWVTLVVTLSSSSMQSTFQNQEH